MRHGIPILPVVQEKTEKNIFLAHMALDCVDLFIFIIWLFNVLFCSEVYSIGGICDWFVFLHVNLFTFGTLDGNIILFLDPVHTCF